MAKQETKADLERRLKALNSLKESTRVMIERYSLFFKNAHDEAVEIEEKLKQMEGTSD